MSIDAVARRAADSAARAALDVDTDAAITKVMRPRPATRRRGAVLVAAAVAAAVVAALFLLMPGGAGLNGQQAPPAGPGADTIGSHMTVPATFTVPEGWRVDHDGGFVLLVADDAQQNGRIFIGSPTARYDEIDRSTSEPDGPWLTWLRGQRYLEAVPVGHPDVDGVRATTVELHPAGGQQERFHIQTALASGTDDTASETLYFAARTGVTSWTVIPTADGEVLVSLNAEERPRASALKALDDVLESLRFEPPASP